MSKCLRVKFIAHSKPTRFIEFYRWKLIENKPNIIPSATTKKRLNVSASKSITGFSEFEEKIKNSPYKTYPKNKKKWRGTTNMLCHSHRVWSSHLLYRIRILLLHSYYCLNATLKTVLLLLYHAVFFLYWLHYSCFSPS